MTKHGLTLMAMLLLYGTATNAQIASTGDEQLLKDAAAYMQGNQSKPYDPKKSFSLHQQLAANGNAKAMNALGVDYSEGLGTGADLTEAMVWFKKAAEAGYTTAWYNLGKIYQRGHGTPQDFKIAFACFTKATEMRDTDSKLTIAYMLFKGLGCQQDYAKAFSIYYPSAQAGNANSMYFVALCLRNGYGVAKNMDQARVWLQKAAAKGDLQSKEELGLANPENYLAQPLETSTLQQLGSGSSKYRRVQHNVTTADLDGSFTGWAVKYDWSGRYIISRSPLQLEMHRNGSESITGKWVENSENISTDINARLTDSALVFDNTAFSRKDHYSAGKEMLWEFKNATMQVVNNGDSIYLVGNLQLYSPERKEPGKPFYVQLVKAATIKAISMPMAHATILQTWPNPFTGNTLNIAFALGQQAPVSIALVSMDGRTIYTENAETLLPGRYTRSIEVKANAGSYIVKLNYGNQAATATVIKQ